MRDEQLKQLANAGDWKGIIDYCSGSNHCDYTSMWALAMTAQYGPVGIHESRLGDNGRPDPAKCSDVPSVFQRMEKAEQDIRARLQ